MTIPATTFVDCGAAFVSPVGGPMTSPVKHSSRRFVAMFAALVAIVFAAGPGRAWAEEDASKKVGTQRIVVDPQAPAPAVAAPVAAGPAKITVTPTVTMTQVAPTLEVHKGPEGLPPAVLEMRRRLLDTAYSGDMQRLGELIRDAKAPPLFSINEIADPIDYLKSQSGDGQGLELLAILTAVLEASWVRLNPGTPDEIYIWPAFAALPLDKLGPGQMVELYKIVTSSDVEEMKGAGHYTFYNVGIGPDGAWRWFKLAD